MSDTVRDGLERAIHATYCRGSDEGPLPMDYVKADAALAYLAARPAVDVEAVAASCAAGHAAWIRAIGAWEPGDSPPPGRPELFRAQNEQIAALLPTAPIRHEPGCHPDPTEDPYHGCECGAVGGQPHGRFAPTAPEVVTTAAELDALPVGSVVLDGMGDAWQRSDASIDWWAPSNPFYCESDALNILELGGTDNPPRVLYRPTVDGAR